MEAFANWRKYSCFSKAINVARPISCCFRNSIHHCAVSTVSTTILSSGPHAVETATSYLWSIAPKSPWTKKQTMQDYKI